jgi:hypothetical protein
MADVNPFALIQQGAENTGQLFANLQRSILQTRELQLQEKSQVFQQGIALRGMDLKEKEMDLNARISMAKLGMAEQEMGMQAALAAARIETEKAHAGLYNAQAWKAQQLKTVAPYFRPPLGGTPDDYRSATRELTGSAAMTTDPVLDEVLNEVASSPPVSPAYQSSRGMSVPDSLGTTSLGIGSGQAFQRGAAQGLNNIMQGVEGDGDLFADSPQAAAPPRAGAAQEYGWDSYTKDIEQWQQWAKLAPDLTNAQSEAVITQLERDRLMAAQNQFSTDPKAQQLLNAQAQEQEQVRQLASQGDRTAVQEIQRSFRDQYGYDNPLYQQAAREGFSEFNQDRQREKAYKRLSELVDMRTKMGSLESPPPGALESIDAEIKQLSAITAAPSVLGRRQEEDALIY